jgi:hypothetical protein
LDSSFFSTRIPMEKVQRISSLIREFSTKKRCTKRELLQLIGHFNFATCVIVLGCSFMSYLFQLSYTVNELHSHVRIDLAMWEHSLVNGNVIISFSIMIEFRTSIFVYVRCCHLATSGWRGLTRYIDDVFMTTNLSVERIPSIFI